MPGVVKKLRVENGLVKSATGGLVDIDDLTSEAIAAFLVRGDTAGGDLAGNYPNPSVARLGGTPIGNFARLDIGNTFTLGQTFADLTVTGTLDVSGAVVAGLGTSAECDADDDTGLSANSSKIVPTQAAVKGYVDGLISGRVWKEAVRVATTKNFYNDPLKTIVTAGCEIDGVVIAVGDRVLIKNQFDAAHNGIYLVTDGGAVRAGDAVAGRELVGATVLVREGVENAGSQWACTTAPPILPGSTPLAWSLIGVGLYGLVPRIDADDCAPLFLSTVTTRSPTPHLRFSPIPQKPGAVYIGPAGIESGRPTFRQLEPADLPRVPTHKGGTGSDLSLSGPGVLLQDFPGSPVTTGRADEFVHLREWRVKPPVFRPESIRTFNSVAANTSDTCAAVGGRFVLSPGWYRADARVLARQAGERLRLVNVTAGETALTGPPTAAAGEARLVGRFSVAAGQVLAVEHVEPSISSNEARAEFDRISRAIFTGEPVVIAELVLVKEIGPGSGNVAGDGPVPDSEL